MYVAHQQSSGQSGQIDVYFDKQMVHTFPFPTGDNSYIDYQLYKANVTPPSSFLDNITQMEFKVVLSNTGTLGGSYFTMSLDNVTLDATYDDNTFTSLAFKIGIIVGAVVLALILIAVAIVIIKKLGCSCNCCGKKKYQTLENI